jgi:predicted nucleic acid-binding protein
MYTLDASVHISALNPHELASGNSQALLRLLHEHQTPLFCPTLLVVEVAAAVARRGDSVDHAIALAALVRDWPGQTLVSLDTAIGDRAAGLAARYHLRGADAVVAAVAQQYGTSLITLDRQQLGRLPAEVRVVRPGDVLDAIAPDASGPTVT